MTDYSLTNLVPVAAEIKRRTSPPPAPGRKCPECDEPAEPGRVRHSHCMKRRLLGMGRPPQ